MNLPPFSYLLEKSKERIKDFGMTHRNRASNSWKDARKSLDEAIEAEALALLALWFEEFGEELIEAARSDDQAWGKTVTPPIAVPPEGTRERPIAGREFWRSSVKRFYRRAG